jgi:hypothetical protein
MAKKYSRAQMDYISSKEHFLQVSEQADKRISSFKEEGKEVGQEEMETIMERTGLHRAFNDLVQTENTLINWTKTAIRHEPEFTQNRDTFEQLYEKVKTDEHARIALIKLAMNLQIEN